jgi:hypothetical protein
MKYLNTILTIIAFLLCILIWQLGFKREYSRASGGIQDVNIKQIGGQNMYSRKLELK